MSSKQKSWYNLFGEIIYNPFQFHAIITVFEKKGITFGVTLTYHSVSLHSFIWDVCLQLQDFIKFGYANVNSDILPLQI
jgi:hypothetical protein